MISAEVIKEIMKSNEVFLKRDGHEIFHWEEDGECDFILKKDGSPSNAIQVSWGLVESNKEREVHGLIQACKSLGLQEGVIITYENEEKLDEKKILRLR